MPSKEYPKSFKERCDIAEKCLPEAQYRECLEKLHKEMLEKIRDLEFFKENRPCMGCWGEIHQCGCGNAKQYPEG